MPYEIRELPLSPNELNGLSEKLIASHYVNNYGGAVRRLNAIQAKLAQLDPSAAPVFELNGLKREELIAYNSMTLHELYFDCLGGSGDPAGELADAIAQSFGSVARWRAEFSAMAKAQAGGSGWVLLMRSTRDGRLINQWAADHTHVLAGGAPILALDMYEHAYHIDFGARAAAYVDALMANVDWAKVAARLRQESTGHEAPANEAVAPENLRELLAGAKPPLVLDVRRARAFDASTHKMSGANWRDPEKVGDWAAQVDRDREVVVYCVYGHNVGQDTAAALRKAGRKARFLIGGFAAWQAIGGETQAKGGG
jgi:Fe-Mn family superoxide dismutase